jgi:hypothetical protein
VIADRLKAYCVFEFAKPRFALRLYFHLADFEEVIQDLDGIEVDNIDQARAETLNVLNEMRHELGPGDWSGWRLIVTDGGGAVVLSFDLGEMPPGPARPSSSWARC